MSEEKLEVVRRIHAAWKVGASASDYMDAEIEYVNPPDAVETGTVRGPDSFDLIRDAYDDVEIHPQRFVDAGGDDVVVVATARAVSRGARIPVEREQGYVWTVREGKAICFRWFNDPREAFAAVDLRE
jgi:ketosteroid isomerase-like protein